MNKGKQREFDCNVRQFDMKTLVIVTVVALIGGCAAMQNPKDYVQGDVSNAQFRKDYADCQRTPITDDTINMAVFASPFALTPHARNNACMMSKGYAMKSQRNCEDGYWDDSTHECISSNAEARRTAGVTPEDAAKAAAVTPAQCAAADGQWDGIFRECY